MLSPPANFNLQKMKRILSYAPMLICLFITACDVNAQIKNSKPRTIITTDGEVDDQDSFIRFLLYANEFKTEGLIYSSSEWHYKGDGKGTKFISEMPYTSKPVSYTHLTLPTKRIV